MNIPAPARAALLLCLLAATPDARQTQQPPQRPPQTCSSGPEHRQFDFWVGEWEVKNPRGQTVGSNSVQLILGDCVVFENWTSARGFSGKSFNVYNRAKGKWQQTWVDAAGNVLELTGGYKDDRMSFEGETPAADGKRTLHRLTFTRLSPDRVRQLWEQSADGGKTWTVAFDGSYIRKK